MSFDITQTPQESIEYTINWPARGLPDNVTISSQALAASSTDFTITAGTITGAGTTVSFSLTGGVAGKFYTITNTVTLSDGEVWQETLSFQCIAIRPI